MEAFLAFLDHVHSMLTTTYHNTPIVLMASPQWTRPDCEAITRYIFERTKTPALCLLHSGVATQYGLRWPSLTVVDIGYEKVDVTCIYENRLVSQRDVRDVIGDGAISGGNVFTKKLFGLLKDKENGFTEEMAEQLKKSNICEVLSYAPERQELMELPTESVQPDIPDAAAPAPAPAAAASGTTVGDAPAVIDAEDGDDATAANDGVLNIADIVTSGQTKEFLAKKEKEKAEKAKAGKKNKAAADAADASRALRLPNSKRLKSVFHYEEVIQEEPSAPPPKANGTTNGSEKKEESAPAATGETSDPAAPPPPPPAEEPEKPKEPEQSSNDPFKVDNFLAPPETTSAPVSSEPQPKRVRRDIEIGLERFIFADRAEIDRIATTIYEAIQNINEMYMRPACWENLVFVGNGSRIRGLKDNIVQTLTARHLVSPSSATMFTSELPSNMATPSGTGSQTPTGSFSGPPHTMTGASSGVNPLLQAATTASLQQAQQQQQHPGMMTPGAAPGSQSGEPVPSHHFHSQTPTTIKMAGNPTYLAEWTKHGFEEAMFLGSLVAARLAFCVHNMDAQGLEAQRLMSLNRVDFK